MKKMPKLDKKDFRILHELDYNARMGLKELGKKVGLSPQTAKYRLDRLRREGVIKGSMAVVDFHRLGFYTYRVYLRLQKATEKEEKVIVDYFVAHPKTIWVVGARGRWAMEVV
ncbi:MAG TPA: winged helix-turn-helix transcriptional regulator, partial [Candidatus Bilamarchaeaceae archaeon]|nr:winged helix-turn-helix transcriptional regulator [Candidatus Bilamarchaeaceae archaeon]